MTLAAIGLLLLLQVPARPGGSIVALTPLPPPAPSTPAAEEATRGQALLFGLDSVSDIPTAITALTHAAAAGSGWADFVLGNLYSRGLGTIAVDHPKALAFFQAGAKLGDARCEAQMGWMYSVGYGVAKSGPDAVRWYRAAALQGDAVGEYGLGDRYGRGDGVHKDPEQAMHWYTLAAAAGHANAAYNLGLYYAHKLRGLAGPADWSRAASMFNQAASQGIFDAQCMLGQLYSAGVGVSKDNVRALAWMTLSLEGGSICTSHIAPLESKMSDAERQRAASLAGAFLPSPHVFTYGRYADH